MGSITSRDRAQAACAERPLRLDPSDPSGAIGGAYFTRRMRRSCLERYGSGRHSEVACAFDTTLDLEWQRAAERAVRSNLPAPRRPRTPRSWRSTRGRARSGRWWADVDFEPRRVQPRDQGARQTGSAFKPFVLAAALRSRVSRRSRCGGPSSMTIGDPRCETTGEPVEGRELRRPAPGHDDALATRIASSVEHDLRPAGRSRSVPEDVACASRPDRDPPRFRRCARSRSGPRGDRRST